MADELERAELEALLRTRQELGAEYDAELVQSFADRIEHVVEERVDARLAHRRRVEREAGGGRTRQFVLGLASLGVGVPVTIVPMVAAEGGLPAVVVAWLGIVGVNAAHASSVNGRREER